MAGVAADFMTPAEAAEAIGVSPQAVRLWCRLGELPAERVPGERTWRIDRRAFEAWAQQRPVVEVLRFLHAPYRSDLSDEELWAEILEADRAAESPSA